MIKYCSYRLKQFFFEYIMKFLHLPDRRLPKKLSELIIKNENFLD